MAKGYKKFGQTTYYRPRKRGGLKPSFSIVKARIPSIERKLVQVDASYPDENDEKIHLTINKMMWIVDDAKYETLTHVVAAHIGLFPEFDGKLRLPSTELPQEHNPDLYAKEGEWECECEEEYIRKNDEPDCKKCGMVQPGTEEE